MKLEGERRKVKEFLERGMSYTDIAQLLGMHRHTVKSLSERDRNHVQKRTKKGSKLDPYTTKVICLNDYEKTMFSIVRNSSRKFENKGILAGKRFSKNLFNPIVNPLKKVIPVGMKQNQENKCKWIGKKLDCIRWMEIPSL